MSDASLDIKNMHERSADYGKTEPEGFVSFYDIKTKYTGILSWLITVDHKKIGIMYLASMLVFFLAGLTAAFIMRFEMLTPGETIIDAQTYNYTFTLHGIIMVFLFIIPGIPAVFGNFFLPIQIGAEDVQFPRLNLLSYYLYVIGGLMAIFATVYSWVEGSSPIDTGWTFYVPYSLTTGANVVVPLLAAFILGFSSILTGLNFVTTVHRLRAPGMSMWDMPLFTWTLYATAWIQVIATPVIGITISLVLMERWLGFGVFDPNLGGDPVLFQHLFWIYSHPAVYIMILPAFGVMSDVICTFSRREIYGYKVMVISTMSIVFIGYLVWAHHMFTSSMSDNARMMFSFFTFLVGVPTGVKVFNWVATLWRGSIKLEAPMLFALGSIFLFSIGGLTGLVLGAVSTDIHLHDTYFVVGHFHYVILGGIVTMFFAAIHYWYPKMFNRMYNKKLANWTTITYFIGVNVLYFPMFIMGYNGMPRRYYDYLPEYQTAHVISTIGSWLLIGTMLVMFGNFIYHLFQGERPGRNPWGAITLEWTTPTPPPLLNFEKPITKVTQGPYAYPDFSEEEEKEETSH